MNRRREFDLKLWKTTRDSTVLWKLIDGHQPIGDTHYDDITHNQYFENDVTKKTKQPRDGVLNHQLVPLRQSFPLECFLQEEKDGESAETTAIRWYILHQREDLPLQTRQCWCSLPWSAPTYYQRQPTKIFRLVHPCEHKKRLSTKHCAT